MSNPPVAYIALCDAVDLFSFSRLWAEVKCGGASRARHCMVYSTVVCDGWRCVGCVIVLKRSSRCVRRSVVFLATTYI
jgi:hypothetical protein